MKVKIRLPKGKLMDRRSITQQQTEKYLHAGAFKCKQITLLQSVQRQVEKTKKTRSK